MRGAVRSGLPWASGIVITKKQPLREAQVFTNSRKLTKKARLATAASLALLASAGLVALTAGASSAAKTGGGVLTLGWGNYGNSFTNNFNPFSATSTTLGEGAIYEPLWYFDPADGSVTAPWLATAYAWSNGGKKLTFTLQKGVSWNDGTPFTSADVAFTFNLLKKDKTLNTYSLPIQSAVAEGSSKVAINFTTEAYADITYIAGDTYIVPQHIWSKVANPSTFVDKNPVGTGAYEVASATPQAITLTANKKYYMPGLPKIPKVEALYYSSNATLQPAIESGAIDWGGSFISNIKRAYEALNPKFVVENLPAAMANIIPNMVKGPMTDLAVRKAFSDAINRYTLDQDVYDGVLPMVSSTGLVTPLFSNVLNPAYAPLANKRSAAGANVAAAKAALTADGYTYSGGRAEKGGSPLTINVLVPDGWSDYQQALAAMVPEEAAAGITMNVVDPAQATALADLTQPSAGTWDAAIFYFGFTTSPYVYLNEMVGPVTPSIGNQGGFSNATVNADLAAIAKMPVETSPAAKKRFYQIEQIVSSNVARIPLWVQQGDAEFNANNVKNFPTPQNPYGESASGIYPSAGWVMSRIELAK
jgi:peptide/nickel transport system substrate-binding protein